MNLSLIYVINMLPCLSINHIYYDNQKAPILSLYTDFLINNHT